MLLRNMLSHIFSSFCVIQQLLLPKVGKSRDLQMVFNSSVLAKRRPKIHHTDVFKLPPSKTNWCHESSRAAEYYSAASVPCCLSLATNTSFLVSASLLPYATDFLVFHINKKVPYIETSILILFRLVLPTLVPIPLLMLAAFTNSPTIVIAAEPQSPHLDISRVSTESTSLLLLEPKVLIMKTSL